MLLGVWSDKPENPYDFVLFWFAHMHAHAMAVKKISGLAISRIGLQFRTTPPNQPARQPTNQPPSQSTNHAFDSLIEKTLRPGHVHMNSVAHKGHMQTLNAATCCSFLRLSRNTAGLGRLQHMLRVPHFPQVFLAPVNAAPHSILVNGRWIAQGSKPNKFPVYRSTPSEATQDACV